MTMPPRSDADDGDGEDLLVREGDVAGDYLERLLDILDVDGDIDLDVEGDRASVAIVGGRLERPDRSGRRHPGGAAGADPARRGPVHRRPQPADARRRRVPGQAAGRPDRAGRRRRPDGSRESGQPERLAPMNPFERKVVHDVIAARRRCAQRVARARSRNRRVVVLPDK